MLDSRLGASTRTAPHATDHIHAGCHEAPLTSHHDPTPPQRANTREWSNLLTQGLNLDETDRQDNPEADGYAPLTDALARPGRRCNE